MPLCVSLAVQWPPLAVGRAVQAGVCACRNILHVQDNKIIVRMEGLDQLTSSICLSSPPMSLYCSVGLSSSSIAFTRESYLGGGGGGGGGGSKSDKGGG